MTRLERGKQTRRVVATDRFGDLVVRATEEGLYLKEKGRRAWLGPMGWADVYIQLAGFTAGKRKPRRSRSRKLGVGI